MAASQHAINGRIGIRTRLSKTTKADRELQATKGQAGLLARFEREVDPEGLMSEADRVEAAQQLRRAHMGRIAKASAASRRKPAQTGT
ncbi:MAG: hypothetical protein ACRDP6_24635 [Actinoallomurus sp.]